MWGENEEEEGGRELSSKCSHYQTKWFTWQETLLSRHNLHCSQKSANGDLSLILDLEQAEAWVTGIGRAHIHIWPKHVHYTTSTLSSTLINYFSVEFVQSYMRNLSPDRHQNPKVTCTNSFPSQMLQQRFVKVSRTLWTCIGTLQTVLKHSRRMKNNVNIQDESANTAKLEGKPCFMYTAYFFCCFLNWALIVPRFEVHGVWYRARLTMKIPWQ